MARPLGKMCPEPCVSVCSGVEKDYSGWINSHNRPGKVYKSIVTTGCDFVSQTDTKIVSTLDSTMGSEPGVRVCSGVDKNYFGWYDSDTNPAILDKFTIQL